jgi:hypothetical protein
LPVQAIDTGEQAFPVGNSAWEHPRIFKKPLSMETKFEGQFGSYSGYSPCFDWSSFEAEIN